jgi:hypothetical protein
MTTVQVPPAITCESWAACPLKGTRYCCGGTKDGPLPGAEAEVERYLHLHQAFQAVAEVFRKQGVDEVGYEPNRRWTEDASKDVLLALAPFLFPGCEQAIRELRLSAESTS